MSDKAQTLSIESLSTGYPGRSVGEGISLSVRSGEIMALLGPNGSGKTTLFKTILGLTPPLGGRTTVDGASTARMSLSERARLFGYVPQASAGFFPYSVREMVLMGRTPHIGPVSAPSDVDWQCTEGAVERVGIRDLAGRDFTRISGGERQLALIARALAQEPAFLLMDEPTASLDFANQLHILQLMRDLASDGIGIVFSTHHPDQALAAATHATLIKPGKLPVSGTVQDVLTSNELSALFGVRLSVEKVAGALVCVPMAPI